MRKSFWGLISVVALVAVSLAATAALAQSSGSFSASFLETQCTINTNNGTFTGGVPGNGSLPDVTVKVSGGSGVALKITPSLVTGLYTSNKISQANPDSTENVGLRVFVEVDGDGTSVRPDLGNGVIYDQRWVKVRSTFLNELVACTTDCFELTMSTLSAKSFDFVISDLAPGEHTISVYWMIEGATNNTATCVGPGTVTVVQVKNFNFNDDISL